MQTNNGTQGQSGYSGQQIASNNSRGQTGYSGQQVANNNSRGHTGFTRQQSAHTNGTHPAISYQTRYAHAMSTPHGTWQIPQGRIQGQPRIAGQQVVNIDGTIHTMPFRNNPRVGMPLAHGNNQLTQRLSRQAQPGFTSQQTVNMGAWNPVMTIHNNHNGMTGASDMCTPVTQQPRQLQNPHAYRIPQNNQNHQYSPNLQNHQNFGAIDGATNVAVYPNSSGGNTPNICADQFPTNHTTHLVNHGPPSAGYLSSAGSHHHTGVESPPEAVSPAEAVPPLNTGAPEPVQPAANEETPESLQTRVNGLVKEKGTTYKGYIRNKADYDRIRQAVWRAKNKNCKLEDKSADYPKDEDGQVEVFNRICDAFVNTSGDQDLASDSAENGNCLAVRTVLGLAPVEVEMIAFQLVVSTTGTRAIIEDELIVTADGHAHCPARRACSSSALQSRARGELHGQSGSGG